MLPKWHILIGAIFSLIIFFLFPYLGLLNILIIFLSTFLIDIDHYFCYSINRKEFDIIKAYNIGVVMRERYRKLSKKDKLKQKRPIFVFHGIEFILLLAILSYFYSLFLFILLGTLIHLLLDYSEMIYYKDPLSFKISQIYLFIKNKKRRS
jgi:hypothetical protein